MQSTIHSNFISRTAAALLVALSLGSIAHAENNSDLQAELAALKAKVEAQDHELAALRDARGETWLDERRAEEVKALVREVLADADTRASLLDSGVSAGYNGSNFFLASEDGAFLLKVGGQIQVRYTANLRDHEPTGTPAGASIDPSETGFSIRRMKLAFDGFIGSPRLEYKVQFDVDRDTGAVNTQDIWIAYNFNESLRVFAGRIPDRFAREAMMSSRNTQAAERSAVAQMFAANDDYVEGAGIEWRVFPDWLIVAGTVNDGLGSGVSGGTGLGFQNGGNDFQNDATDIAFTGRADLKLAGDWKQAGDVEAWSGAKGLQAFLGAGVHYEVGETGDRQASSAFTLTPPSPTLASVVNYDSFSQWTADALVKFHGLGVMGSVYGWHITDAAVRGTPAGLLAAGPRGTLDNYAATIQAGYFVIPDKLEPFARYEWIWVEDALGGNDLNLVTGGVNYFFRKHNAKFTLDAVWAVNNVNSTNTLATSLSGAGLLPDARHQNDQVTVRGQFQLLF